MIYTLAYILFRPSFILDTLYHKYAFLLLIIVNQNVSAYNLLFLCFCTILITVWRDSAFSAFRTEEIWETNERILIN